MKNLITEVVEEYKFENPEIQQLVYRIKSNTQIQLKADFDLLVNLYRLKLKFEELSKNVPEVNSETYREMCVHKGKRKEFTYFKLCKELFGIEEKTVYKYNQFTKSYVENVENLAGENNILNNPVYKFEVFYNMSISKLMELNTLTTWEVEKLIQIGVLTDKLTKNQIRTIVKRLKEIGYSTNLKKEDFIGLDSEEEKEPKEKVEEPEFIIDNDYNLFDFKAYSKSKLALIAFDCYTKYHKLCKQLEKLKKVGK